MSSVIPDPALTDWVPLGGVGGGGSVIALQEVIVPVGGAASIAFSNIPQGYRDLRIVGQATVGAVWLNTWFNGDVAANYDYVTSQQYGGGSPATIVAEGVGVTAGRTAFLGAVMSAWITEIPGYSFTTIPKLATTRTAYKGANATQGMQIFNCDMGWRSNAAITALSMAPSSGTFPAGSRATLYGIAAPITTLPL